MKIIIDELTDDLKDKVNKMMQKNVFTPEQVSSEELVRLLDYSLPRKLRRKFKRKK